MSILITVPHFSAHDYYFGAVASLSIPFILQVIKILSCHAVSVVQFF